MVIKTGTAAGGGENEHFRIKGGDGIVGAYLTNANFGIGTSTPNWSLQVASSTQTFLALSATDAGLNAKHWLLSSQGGNLYVGTSSDALNATSTYLTIANGGYVGIGTTSPYAPLSVVGLGGVVAGSLNATTTTATSTLSGGFIVGPNAQVYDLSTGATSISNLNVGSMQFDTNAGPVSWVDLPVTSSAPSGSVQSYSAMIGGTSTLTIYGESNGSGGVQNLRVGIGTTSPGTTLTVQGGVCITTGNSCPAEVSGGLSVDTTGSIVDDPGDVFDIAERYPATEMVEAGDVVALDKISGQKAAVKKGVAGDVAVGIVSTAPALTINGSDLTIGPAREATSTKPMVALAGRVPVKVNLEGGDIKTGDYLTLSSVSGVATKAVASGDMIGVALEDFPGDNDQNSQDKILVFVKPGYQKLGNDNSSSLPQEINLSFGDQADETFFDKIISTLKSWLLSTKDLVFNRLTAFIGSFQKVETKTISVENGIELKDTNTGETYCVQIRDGEWYKFKGTCGLPAQGLPAQSETPEVQVDQSSDNPDTNSGSTDQTSTDTPPIISDDGTASTTSDTVSDGNNEEMNSQDSSTTSEVDGEQSDQTDQPIDQETGSDIIPSTTTTD